MSAIALFACNGGIYCNHQPGTCTATWPPRDGWHTPVNQIPQRGCICPPTSEQTCKAPLCPRQPYGQVT